MSGGLLPFELPYISLLFSVRWQLAYQKKEKPLLVAIQIKGTKVPQQLDLASLQAQTAYG